MKNYTITTRSFLDEIEKVSAFTLPIARKTTGLLRKHIIRRTPSALKSGFGKLIGKGRLGVGPVAQAGAGGKIFAKGDVIRNKALKGFIPKTRMRRPHQREMLSRVGLSHEGIEKRVFRGLVKRNPQAKARLNPEGVFGPRGYYGHASPEVIFREHNIVSTLPKKYKGVKRYYQKMRSGKVDQSARDLQKSFPGFRYGEQRLSRHAIRRMTQSAERKAMRQAHAYQQRTGAIW